MALRTFLLPLPSQLPSGYEWDDRSISHLSNSTDFKAAIYQRDMFLGAPACVVCGAQEVDKGYLLDHCHIITMAERVRADVTNNLQWLLGRGGNV